ncbi:DUF4394 domain-containing protein [Hymenobacter sp. IS2118]|uniref:DUF4394 domain-containing protein n=1 Tax=Hymenobacter sp. IS2118 TaxID=1505605 RepID=UPI00068ED5E3|nr:DUF4394 domain-containing protein [Hymenobacter sp. IS2118]
MFKYLLSLLPVGRQLRGAMSTALVSVLALSSTAAQAQSTIYGLGTATGTISGALIVGGAVAGTQGLAPVDPATGLPKASSYLAVRITGVTVGQLLVGIDYRPSTGEMYALGYNASNPTGPSNAQLYTLQPLTGVATAVGSAITLALGGPAERIGFDFNPVADRIRVVSTNDTNYRLNPITGEVVQQDGTLVYAVGDINAAKDPRVGAVAYTNSLGSPTSTTLYSADVRPETRTARGILATLPDPNSGVMKTVTGSAIGLQDANNPNTFYNIEPTAVINVDIYFDGTTNKAYMSELTKPNGFGLSSTNLYDLNLANGQATNKRNLVPANPFFPFNIRDIAVAPAPTITSLVPAVATINGPAFTLTVNGTGFVNGAVVNGDFVAGSQVFFNGTARTTTFVSTTQLTAQILATDITTLGIKPVKVVNPEAPGGTSNESPFEVVPVCDAPTNLAVTNITDASATVTFTGSASATGYTITTVPATTTQTLPGTATSADLTGLNANTAYTVNIVSSCASSTTSSTVSTDFTTTPTPNPAPTISSLSPSSATAGDPAFTLTVTGTGFIAGSVVSFGGTARATTFVSATQVTASIPALAIAMAGTYNVTVTNAAPGGGTSAPATFTVIAPVVNNPVPAISSLSPASVTAGAAPQTLTVSGSNFLATSVVNFDGSARTTTFVSATQLTIGLTAPDQAMAGTYSVTVTNPVPGGGTSAPATFTVNPAPVACTAPTGLTAGSITASSATVTFTGSASATSYTVTTDPATTTQTLLASATSVSFTGLAASTAYTVRIVSNCASSTTSDVATASFTTLPAGPITITWTGVVSTAWEIPGNWSPAQVPTAADNIRIPDVANDPLISTSQQGRNLAVENGATLTFVGSAVLDLKGAFSVGTPGSLFMSPASLVSLTGPDAVGISGGIRFSNLLIGPAGATLNGIIEVQRMLTLNGNLGAVNQFNTGLVLLSDAQGTAMVVNNGTAAVNALATVQRYITPTNPGLGYRHYSSPVQATTVADLNTAGFSAVVNPAYNTLGNTVKPFPNVFGYDETRVSTSASTALAFDQGFFSPTTTSDVLEPTRGYTVNIPAQANVDFVGTLNNGNLTATGLTRGNQPKSGWHLRGNPYPSSLDWNKVGKTGLEGGLYVFKSSGQYTGSYATYNNGMSTNGGTNIVPVAQGFFVRTAVGQTGSLAFANADRITTNLDAPFQRGTTDTRPQLRLALGNAKVSTQAVVYFERGATAGFDNAFDAHALPASTGLALATETDALEALAINGQPQLAGTEVLLPLRLTVPTAGTYALRVETLANLPAPYRAYLRDALTGSYTDLSTTPAVSLNLTANANNGRYALLFSTQARVLATAPAALAQLASVYPNPAHGTATLLLPTKLRGNAATAVTIVDNLGRVVLARTFAAGPTETLELPLNTLSAGVYTVLARTTAGLVAKRLVVE